MSSNIDKIKFNITKIAVIFPYSENKEFKEKYNVRYCPEAKYWYFPSLNNGGDIADGLKDYIRVELNIDKNDVSSIRNKCKSLKYCKIANKYYCSTKDYEELKQYIITT